MNTYMMLASNEEESLSTSSASPTAALHALLSSNEEISSSASSMSPIAAFQALVEDSDEDTAGTSLISAGDAHVALMEMASTDSEAAMPSTVLLRMTSGTRTTRRPFTAADFAHYHSPDRYAEE
jgi:hypothetical protein